LVGDIAGRDPGGLDSQRVARGHPSAGGILWLGQVTIRVRLMINLETSAHQVSGQGRLHYGLRLHLPLQIGRRHRWMEPGVEDEAAKLGSSGDPER